VSGGGQPGGARRIFAALVILARLVRLEEVLFSLPLAYAGALLGAHGWPGLAKWCWVTLAVAGGKVGGMALNRLIDRDIDAANPATADRPLPAGLVSPGAALAVGVGGLALLAVAAFALNPLCAELLPLVVALIAVYSFTKRWGWGCHFALAAVGFFLPFAGWIAVTGRFGAGPLLFGAAAGFWYVGFDSLYALRDVEVDRRQGLHSLPADLGVPATLGIAGAAHAGFLILLACLGLAVRLPWPYWAAVGAAGAALAAQHAAARRALRPVAFARFNTCVACALLAGTVASAMVGLGGLR
jgi:4-hydroxybenzoate polyprenyltransferase